jgi:hypothetical protein
MKQEEIQERNKQIALMLGWKITDGIISYIPEENKFQHEVGYSANGFLRFHSDWNWLMEALEFLRIKGWCYDSYSPISDDTLFECNIWNKETTEVEGRSADSLKEATFLAVSDFAKLYNENKL